MALYNFLIVHFFFFCIFPYASSLYFNLTRFGTTNNNRIFNLSGDASILNQVIEVTPNAAYAAGRAIYGEPLHLWDRASGNLTDFTTHFSFVVDSHGNDSFFADGLAFFLAPVGSSIPADMEGSGLALALPRRPTDTNANQFVAVEFDTFQNEWDTDTSPHVGIDINSVRSVTTALWLNNISAGAENDAWISYDSISKNLSVVFTGSRNGTISSGTINCVVDLSNYLPEWVAFGFSAASGFYFEDHIVRSWEFNSTLQNGTATESTPSPTPDVSGTVTGGTTKKKTGLIVGVSIGVSVLLGGLALIGYCLWKKRNDGEEKQDEFVFEFEQGSRPKKFSYTELIRATSNFNEKELLGQGGFGGVYRGFLKELNSDVAIKRVSRGSKQGIKEYMSEVIIISQVRHRNLVQLIGWCHEKKDLLLIYEFMPNGSLDSHLFHGKSLLTWVVRFKIARGLASGLLYLHEEWERCVLHRDIKSSNVMLDSNFNAKLGDFGLARLVDHEKGLQTTMLAGTRGYIAPECFATGKGSKESDVYSFGVVALEIACGRKPVDLNAEENQVIMVEWVWDLYGMGRILDAADPKLSADFSQQEMEYLMIVGLWCTHPYSNMRPSIRQAILVLNFESPLPILPLKMPVATYSESTITIPKSSSSGTSGGTTGDSASIDEWSSTTKPFV